MSIFYLFDVLKVESEFEAEYDIFGENMDTEDVLEWAKATRTATADPLKGLKCCDTIDDAIAYLSITQQEATERAINKTKASPELIKLVRTFYNYNFKAFNKGFLNDDDFSEYLETLAEFLPEGEELPEADKFAIRCRYWELIDNKLFDDFKGYKLDTIEKTKIIGAFAECYEGYSMDSEEFLKECEAPTESEWHRLFNPFFKYETLEELLEAFADWVYWFFEVGDDGEPTREEPRNAVYFVSDCIRWGRV